MKPFRSQRPFGFERLERRQMLAGNVTGNFINGVYTLVGDDASNGIAIVCPVTGEIAILGLNTAGGATTINGHADLLVVGVGSIAINMKSSANAAGDVVVITAVGVDGAVSIHMGLGNDFVGLGDFDNSGGTIDTVVNPILGPLTVSKGITIDMGGGDNQLMAKDVTAQGPIGNNFAFTAGNGTDTLSLENVSAVHSMSITDGGTAHIDSDHLSAKNLNIALGSGNNQLSLDHTTVTGVIAIHSVAGSDVVDFDTATVGALNAALGGGDNQLNLSNIIASQKINIGTGNGNDQISISNCTVALATTVATGAGNDTVMLDTDTLHALGINLGAGDDQATMTSVTSSATTINGGAGNNTVMTTGLQAAALTITGGNGVDQITCNSSTIAHAAKIDAGAGDDSVNLNGLISNSLNVLLDAGNDDVTLQNNNISAAAFVVGGIGNDTYTNAGGNTFGTFTPKGIEVSA